MLKQTSTVFLFLIFLPFFVLADDTRVAVIDNLDNSFDLAPFVETIEDPKHEYQLKDIQAGKYDHLWQRHTPSGLLAAPSAPGATSAYFVGRNLQSKYWFRYTIEWQATRAENGVLLVNTHPSLLLRLGVVLPVQGNQSGELVYAGMLEPFESRLLPGFQYAFEQELIPGRNTTVYGWARNDETATPVHLPFLFIAKEQLAQINQNHNGILIAFYTLMFALLVYNGFLFAALRQSVYGVYLLFICSAVLATSTLDGTASRYLWPDDPQTLARVINANGPVLAIAYLLSVVSALDGVRQWPYFNKIIVAFVSVATLSSIYNLFSQDYRVAMAGSQILGSINIVLTFVIIIRAMTKGLPTAGYFFTAEVMMLIGTSLFMLVVQGLVPIHPLTSWGMHWGIAGETLLLSLALAARTRIAQQAAIENQQAAINNLQKYESLYNDSVEGLFQYEFNTRSLRCNDALARLFGFGKAAQIPQAGNFLSYFSQELLNELEEMLLTQGRVQNFETEIDHQNSGNKLWVSMTLRLMKNSDGTAVGAEGSIVDISERKLKELAEKQQAMAQKNEEISEAKNRAKTQFFASMSHEFRTPLTTILGYTKIARSESVKESERIGHIKTIESSAQHMLQLINDVLDLSKIEKQQLDVEAIPVNLQQVSQQVYDIIWILASQKGISFNVDYQLPLPETFISDPTRLKQALINLCTNAVKFTLEGGATLHISCDLNNESIIFSVEDTGIGLKPEQQEHLFEAYSQADTTTLRNFGGTGLGLHLSKLIANKLGGDITVESKFGKGSIFSLSVGTGPLEKATWIEVLSERKTAATPVSVHEDLASATGETMPRAIIEEFSIEEPSGDIAQQCFVAARSISVLLAEDNEVNQLLMEVQIKQAGAEVDVANDGLEAIALALLKDYGLILMDMEMPKMDGVTAVKYLREKGVQTHIIALTGNVSPQSVKQCEAAGCDGHLSKPLDMDKLKAIFDAITRKSADTSILPIRKNDVSGDISP